MILPLLPDEAAARDYLRDSANVRGTTGPIAPPRAATTGGTRR
jgi:hypothetical protein